MKHALTMLAAMAMAFSLASCDEPLASQSQEFAGPRATAESCVKCPDALGVLDVLNLCTATDAGPSSQQLWTSMRTCICSGPCAGVCGADWCARLFDLSYTDANTACGACAIAVAPTGCWTQVFACGDDNPIESVKAGESRWISGFRVDAEVLQ